MCCYRDHECEDPPDARHCGFKIATYSPLHRSVAGRRSWEWLRTTRSIRCRHIRVAERAVCGTGATPPCGPEGIVRSQRSTRLLCGRPGRLFRGRGSNRLRRVATHDAASCTVGVSPAGLCLRTEFHPGESKPIAATPFSAQEGPLRTPFSWAPWRTSAALCLHRSDPTTHHTLHRYIRLRATRLAGRCARFRASARRDPVRAHDERCR